MTNRERWEKTKHILSSEEFFIAVLFAVAIIMLTVAMVGASIQERNDPCVESHSVPNAPVYVNVGKVMVPVSTGNHDVCDVRQSERATEP